MDWSRLGSGGLQAILVHILVATATFISGARSLTTSLFICDLDQKMRKYVQAISIGLGPITWVGGGCPRGGGEVAARPHGQPQTAKVAEFIHNFCCTEMPLDVLVCNAAIYLPTTKEPNFTAEGGGSPHCSCETCVKLWRPSCTRELELSMLASTRRSFPQCGQRGMLAGGCVKELIVISACDL
ncbi:hypothetical protein Taro_017861 [Colocasia esculenta]|uniref:Uncharacterized protein n=1 Tax=Colocasia esculenta TaxID=4460 RepID=A0A843UPU6_COLES|nr:hypothetical protein [Colocasia esculenta]